MERRRREKRRSRWLEEGGERGREREREAAGDRAPPAPPAPRRRNKERKKKQRFVFTRTKARLCSIALEEQRGDPLGVVCSGSLTHTLGPAGRRETAGENNK
jgi:hypothetical protein